MAIDGITKLRKTGTQSIATGAWRIVTWDVEDYDNLGAFTSGTSTSNIVVPSGMTWMRPALLLNWANNSTSGRYINLTDGTRTYLGDIRASFNETLVSLCPGWIPCTATTTIRLEVNSGSQTLNIGGTFGHYPELTVEWASALSDAHA
jgi:hypothetical protein